MCSINVDYTTSVSSAVDDDAYYSASAPSCTRTTARMDRKVWKSKIDL